MHVSRGGNGGSRTERWELMSVYSDSLSCEVLRLPEPLVAVLSLCRFTPAG